VVVADLHLDPAIEPIGLDHEEIGLARSESSVQTTLSPSVVDLVGSIITVDVPHELNVWVVCRVPYLGCARRGALATVYLTDEAGGVIDATALKAATRHHIGFVVLTELVLAGSGTITRKLRACTSGGRGYANLGGAGHVTMDAYIR
jgi:hypothetical protein